MPTLESPESAVPSREAVTALLREKGPDDTGAREMLSRWLDHEQARAEKGEITDLEYNISWAELYRDAGFTEQALEAYATACELAYQRHENAVYVQLSDEIAKLEAYE